MDRRDDDLGRFVFTEDCTMDYGPNFQGTGWEFVTWAHQAHDANYEQTTHQITNVLIEVNDDGTKAVSETYLHTLQLTPPDAKGRQFELHIAGRYLDKWVLENQGPALCAGYCRAPGVPPDVPALWRRARAGGPLLRTERLAGLSAKITK